MYIFDKSREDQALKYSVLDKNENFCILRSLKLGKSIANKKGKPYNPVAAYSFSLK